MAKKELKELAVSVGKAIATHRQACGLTQEDVAERLKIGNEAVSRMERGIVMPTFARLVDLSHLFGLDVSTLLVTASNQPADQAQYLKQLLSRLDASDRSMIVEMVETIAARLSKDRTEH